MVGSLAWPVVIIVVAILFRSKIEALLARPARRWKFGPVEAEWEETVAETRVELAKSPEAAESGAASAARSALLWGKLRTMADVAPTEAVLAAFAEIERTVRAYAAEADVKAADGGPLRFVLRQMQEAGALSSETVNSISGLVVLRNLAAGSPGHRIEPERAVEFLALAEGVLYAIESHRRRTDGGEGYIIPDR
jgi:hypothetical protein